MTPSQLSNELRKIAKGIESANNPSRALVASALRSVIAKAVTSDEQYAAWATKAQECWGEVKSAEEALQTCQKSGDWNGASKACMALSKALSSYGQHCEGNKTYENVMRAEMEKGEGSHGA